MVDKVLKFILLISPIAYTFGLKIVRFEIICFHLCALILFLASLLDSPKRDNPLLSKGIFLFLGFCLLNTAIHSFPIFSMGALFNLFLFCIALNIIYRYMDSPRKYYPYILVAAIINILVYLGQRYLFNFLPYETYSLGGFFGSGPRLGNYLSTITPIVFPYLWFIIPVIAVMSHSLVPIGIILLLVVNKIHKSQLNRKMIFYFLVGGISGAFLYLFRAKIIISILVRSNAFVVSIIKEIFKFPLFGHGLGSYSANIGNDPLNSLISFSYDVGFLGILLIGWGIWMVRKYFTCSIESFSLIGIILLSLIDYPLEIPRLWPTIAFIVAAFFIKKEEIC